MTRAERQRARVTSTRDALGDLPARLAAIDDMDTAALVDEYRRVVGEEPRSHSRAWLCKRLAWRIQEQTHGGLDERALGRIEELAATSPVRHLEPRVGPTGAPTSATAAVDPDALAEGTVLRREHGGRTHEVTLTTDGFVWGGATYGSLSAVAKAITGTHWNGRLFFGLAKRGARKGAR